MFIRQRVEGVAWVVHVEKLLHESKLLHFQIGDAASVDVAPGVPVVVVRRFLGTVLVRDRSDDGLVQVL